MRLGLIGDVHAEDELLLLTLEALRRERVDRILCTGDLVDGKGDPDRTCALLEGAGVTTVRGNHDRWIRSDEMRSLPEAHRMPDLAVPTVAYLKGLPATVTLDVPGGKLLLCHGAGTDDMAQVLPHDRGHALASNEAWTRVLFDPDVRFMVCGHTHQAMLRQFARGSGRSPLVVVNAGSLARDAPPGFVVLDLARGTVDFHRIENGAPRRETCAVL